MSILRHYDITTCRYTSPTHDTIEVLYKAENENELSSYFVPAIQPDNEDLKYLLANGWDFEQIDRTTTAYNKSQKGLFRQFHRYLAKEEVARLQGEMEKKIELLKQDELQKSNIIAAVVTNNSDEEAVFRAKLAAFEIPAIKDSKDKDLKMNIRKSKTIAGVVALIKDMI
jgi:hypothetical protein